MSALETHPSRRILLFDPYELDLRAGELRKHGIRLKLQDQPFRILEILLERPGEVISREELQRKIWPSDTFVDFDRGLNNAVKRLREVLADSADHPRYIETLPKRGYRFIASVQMSNGNGAKPTEQAVPSEVRPRPESKTPPRRIEARKVTISVAGGIVLLMAVVLVLGFGNIRELVAGKVSPPPIRSIAVLPLQSLSSDPSQEYLADGIADALITDLAQIGSLKVVSRTSTMQYRNAKKTMPEIARELNVDGIVEGTVQRSGDRVQITAQLIHGPSDTHFWAKSYERDSQNILALERDVARDITEEIRASLTPREKARLASNRQVSLTSLQAYLQGQYHAGQADNLRYGKGMRLAEQKELATARDFFERALREDPNYAQVYVGLASTWTDQPVSEGGPEKADKMLRKALELDPDLAEAHQALATHDVLRQWRWAEAESEYKRAIEINPNYAEAHARYGEYLDMMGRFDEGMKEFLRAQELDPGHNFNPNPFYRRRQFDRAIEIDQNEVRRHAFGFWSHANLAFDYDGAGRHDEATQEWEEVLRMLGYREIADAMHRNRLRSGYKGALKALTDGLEAETAHGSPPPDFFPAMMYGLLGEKDKAFVWLEKGYRHRASSFSALNADPCWDPLRSDPRFVDLVRRVGLPH